MNIYEFDVQEGYESAVGEEDSDIDRLLELDGSRRAETWTPVRVELVREDQGRSFRPSDVPWFLTRAPILKQPAVDALGEALSHDGELLPLLCAEADLWIFNVTTVIDALDVERSDLLRFPTGRIMKIKSHVFRPDLLRDVFAFRIPQKKSLFVTDEVVSRAANLTGVGFRLVWEGEGKAA